MAAQEINRSFLNELEAMGFSEAQATKALLFSGNSSIEEAINWIIDHENDTNIDENPSVSVNIEIEDCGPSQVHEHLEMKAQELRPPPIRERARRKKEEEERNREREREREKERVRSGKELLATKRMAEENDRKRFIAQRKAEKEEERREREKIRQKLQQDKLERWGRLGMPKADPTSSEPSISLVAEREKSPSRQSSKMHPKSASIAELMRECLRSLKRRNKDDEVKRAFQTLLIYIRNVVNNPDEPKFRKIRLSNPVFQDRVGRLKEGIQFLELCGFKKFGEFLVLPRDKVDMSLLKSAGTIIHSASTNPFFGLLSTSTDVVDED